MGIKGWPVDATKSAEREEEEEDEEEAIRNLYKTYSG